MLDGILSSWWRVSAGCSSNSELILIGATLAATLVMFSQHARLSSVCECKQPLRNWISFSRLFALSIYGLLALDIALNLFWLLQKPSEREWASKVVTDLQQCVNWLVLLSVGLAVLMGVRHIIRFCRGNLR